MMTVDGDHADALFDYLAQLHRVERYGSTGGVDGPYAYEDLTITGDTRLSFPNGRVRWRGMTRRTYEAGEVSYYLRLPSGGGSRQLTRWIHHRQMLILVDDSPTP